MNFLDPRLPDRFWSKCIPEPNSGCWLWLGVRDRDDRGFIKWMVNGKRRPLRAYRLSVSTVADLPDGMTVDHLCENPNCVNPSHCEVVSFVENTRRYHVRHPRIGGFTRGPSRPETHCSAGHEYAVVGKDSHYRCRVCYARRMREYRASRRAQAVQS